MYFKKVYRRIFKCFKCHKEFGTEWPFAQYNEDNQVEKYLCLECRNTAITLKSLKDLHLCNNPSYETIEKIPQQHEPNPQPLPKKKTKRKNKNKNKRPIVN